MKPKKQVVTAYTILIISLYLLQFFFELMIIYSSSKRNKKLEKMLNQITGKKYFVRIMNGIEQPNAFCFGGIGKSVFMTDGLVKLLNEREIIAVCLHEVSHIINYDMIKSIASTLGLGGFASLIITKIDKFFYNSKINNINLEAFLFSITATMVLVLSILSRMYLSRRFEYRSDKYTIRFGYGKDLITALEKVTNEKYRKNPEIEKSRLVRIMNKIVELLSTHPTLQKRVENLLEEIKLYESICDKKVLRVKLIIKRYLTNEE